MKKRKKVNFRKAKSPSVSVMGTLLRQKRELLGETIVDVSAKLHITKQFIQRVEMGITPLPFKQASKFMKQYGIDKDTIINAYIADYLRKINKHLHD